MTVDEVRKYYGNSYQFKKRTGMSDATFRNWMKRGFIPEESQYKLDRITNGKLKMEEADNNEIKKELENDLNRVNKKIDRLNERKIELINMINELNKNGDFKSERTNLNEKI
jgi:hypothetical protein